MSCTAVMTSTLDRSTVAEPIEPTVAASAPGEGRGGRTPARTALGRRPGWSAAPVDARSSRTAGDWRDLVPMPGPGIVRP